MKPDAIFIFETDKAESLYPFSVMHTSWEVRCGALRLFEKVQKFFPNSRLIFEGRTDHLQSFLARFNFLDQSMKRENILILHSAILPNKKFLKNLIDAYKNFTNEKNSYSSVVFTVNKIPVAAYVLAKDRVSPNEKDKELFPRFLSDFALGLNPIEVARPNVINYLWDTFDLVGDCIKDDWDYFQNFVDFSELNKTGVYSINNDNIKIGKNSQISPGVVLDASNGHIIIGNDVKIMPNAVIIGPCFIGDNSIIKIGAKIYQNTSIGEWCKVGGEVENSIIHAYSNKQHDGFLGHSYIGEWVNLGADTNTSDLKNTYGEIKVLLRQNEINTNRIFLGLLCGDHTKSAINTSFTTGTVAGISGIIVSDGFLPNSIPSFAWRGNKGCTHYKLEKAIEIANKVMQRRNKSLLNEEKKLMEKEFNNLYK